MSELKYKVGDKVRIKSIDWYNENKNEYGDVPCGYEVFIDSMTGFCGKVVTIENCYESEGYTLKEDYDEWTFTDEMIESLVERNGKTYPYKIGDRVVLKGNNRCATITDLKYNSWGNLSYYIKIDNDKDISIDYPTDLLLPYDNKIKGFIEEETIPIPKFKVGDKITNGKVTLTILTLSLDRYVVEDTFRKCGTLYFNSQDEWKIVEEECPQDFIEKYCKSCGTQRCDRTKEYLNGCPYYNAYLCKKQNNDMEKEDLNLKFNAGDRVFNKVTRKWVNIIEFDIETGLYIVRYDDGIQGRSLESELCETRPSFKEIKEVVKKKAEVYINKNTELDGLSKSLLYEGFVDGMMTALIEMEE